MRRSIVLAAAIALAAPAFAQQGQYSALENDLMFIASACMDARAKTDISVEDKLGVCERGLVALDKATNEAMPLPNQRETNIWREMRAYINTSRAGFYIDIDKVRSQRACAAVEAAWTDISGVSGASLPGTESMVIEMQKSMAASTRTCRKDFGMPPDGKPVPAE
jgi:hypothetical protein